MASLEELNEDMVRVIEHYNPVTVKTTEAVGTIALAIISVILLFALLRSQKRIQALQEALAQAAETVDPDQVDIPQRQED
jgi:hypothetical protein